MSTTRNNGNYGDWGEHQWWPLAGGAVSGLVIGAAQRRYPDVGLPMLMVVGLVNALVFGLVVRAFTSVRKN